MSEQISADVVRQWLSTRDDELAAFDVRNNASQIRIKQLEALVADWQDAADLCGGPGDSGISPASLRELLRNQAIFINAANRREMRIGDLEAQVRNAREVVDFLERLPDPADGFCPREGLCDHCDMPSLASELWVGVCQAYCDLDDALECTGKDSPVNQSRSQREIIKLLKEHDVGCLANGQELTLSNWRDLYWEIRSYAEALECPGKGDAK